LKNSHVSLTFRSGKGSTTAMENGPETVAAAKKIGEESQKEDFPYLIDPEEVFGLKIEIHEGVFSPKYAKAYSFFTPHLPNLVGKQALEIGSGHGVTSCYLARSADFVLATDINGAAVENTKVNAALNGLKNIEARQSNVYSGIRPEEKFDLIYWNTPWVKVPKEFEAQMSAADYGVFDPGYESISQFILEGPRHLTPGGSLYMGFGDHGADTELIEKLILQANLKKETVADTTYAPPETGPESAAPPYTLRLYKLTPV